MGCPAASKRTAAVSVPLESIDDDVTTFTTRLESTRLDTATGAAGLAPSVPVHATAIMSEIREIHRMYDGRPTSSAGHAIGPKSRSRRGMRRDQLSGSFLRRDLDDSVLRRGVG